MIISRWLQRGASTRTKLGIVFLLGGLLALAVFTFTSATRDPDVVLYINGEPLTKERFYQRLEQDAGEQVLSQLIAEMLVEQAERLEGAAVTQEEIEAELNAFIEGYSSQDEFLSDLERFGMTLDELKYEIRLSLIIEKLSRRGVTVTEDEVSAYFAENKALLDEPEEALVRHILVETEEEAAEIVQLLKDGADFAELARSRSIDTASAQRGGSIGYIQPDSPLVAPFKEAVFRLEAGQTSEPIRSEFGWHIIRVDERHEAREATLESSRERIREHLIYEKAKSVNEVIEELHQKANIDVLWPRYDTFSNQP